MVSDENTDLNEVKDEVQKFVDNRDWNKFHNPKDLSISISIEAAELMEIFQWKSESKIEDLKNDPYYIDRIKEELADVLMFSISMANRLDIDVSEAVFDKLEKNKEKYPVEKAYGKADKYNEL